MMTLPVLLDKLKDIARFEDWIVLDTETTGLKRPCEIIDIAVIEHTGEILLDTLIKPRQPISPFITDLTGIDNEMVANAPTWPDVKAQILQLIKGRVVLTYNAVFDRHMLHCSDDMWGLPQTDYKADATWFCVMEAYAELHGQWNDYHRNYRWQKLTDAMNQQGLEISNAHRALGDTLMTWQLVDWITR